MVKLLIILLWPKVGKPLSASTTGSGNTGGSTGGGNANSGGGHGGSGSASGDSGEAGAAGNNSGGSNLNSNNGTGAAAAAGSGSLSGGGIVAVKQETVDLGTLAHGSYTMVDSTTFLSNQQQRINNPSEDDEVPTLPSMSFARCEAMFVSLCMSMSAVVTPPGPSHRSTYLSSHISLVNVSIFSYFALLISKVKREFSDYKKERERKRLSWKESNLSFGNFYKYSSRYCTCIFGLRQTLYDTLEVLGLTRFLR